MIYHHYYNIIQQLDFTFFCFLSSHKLSIYIVRVFFTRSLRVTKFLIIRAPIYVHQINVSLSLFAYIYLLSPFFPPLSFIYLLRQLKKKKKRFQLRGKTETRRVESQRNRARERLRERRRNINSRELGDAKRNDVSTRVSQPLVTVPLRRSSWYIPSRLGFCFSLLRLLVLAHIHTRARSLPYPPLPFRVRRVCTA